VLVSSLQPLQQGDLVASLTKARAEPVKIFVAGASGAAGRQLVPVLVQAGHSVVGTMRDPGKMDAVRAAGAEPLLVDALDRVAVRAAVMQARPDVVIHELTALTALTDLRKLEAAFALTNRLRTEGLDYLLEAAREAGARRFIAQSYTGWTNGLDSGPVKTEADPLPTDPPRAFRRILEAIRYLEATVPAAPGLEGLVLRYGNLYGPGTSIGEGGDVLEEVRRRRLPLIGKGTGVWSWVHVEDAARATLAAVERGAPGIYNIVDDDPAPVSEWLPFLAAAVAAQPPRRVPAWLARFFVGEHGVAWMLRSRGASNAKAKRELGWQPVFASWRDGFRSGLGPRA